MICRFCGVKILSRNVDFHNFLYHGLEKGQLSLKDFLRGV